jgi:hypothetical protein
MGSDIFTRNFTNPGGTNRFQSAGATRVAPKPAVEETTSTSPLALSNNQFNPFASTGGPNYSGGASLPVFGKSTGNVAASRLDFTV